MKGYERMKYIRKFLDFVEINTKIASVFPFLVGAGYVLYRYGSLKPEQTLVFFAAMLLFDMTTTAINNHIGHRQTGRVPHYPKAVSVAIIFAMGLSAAALGLYLVSISGTVILLAGMICFAVGVTYSYGFIPITRTPFGEILSGVVMGFFIPFIVVQINNPLINIAFYDFSRVVITVNWMELLALGVVVIPLVCCIANIMLANNICDVEEDTRVKRYTLPFYIGVEKALLLHRLIYIKAYLFIVVAVALRIVPVFTLALLVTCVPVKKNVTRFMALQDKKRTFFTAILNFLLIVAPYAAFVWLGGLLSIG